ncbi:hypothetical protein T265_12882, partial [Opisthorchis viverrini]
FDVTIGRRVNSFDQLELGLRLSSQATHLPTIDVSSMVSLDNLPPEVFHRICFFLHASDVIALRLVSKKFRSWTGIKFWQKRLLALSAGAYPCLQDKKVDWIHETVAREMYLSVFGQNGTRQHFVRPCATSVAIDVLHIPPVASDLLLVGDRGRVISIFSLKEMALNKDPWNAVYVESRLHLGWIWSIESFGYSVLTGSWDKTLRLWNLSDTGLVPHSVYHLPGPVFSTAFFDPSTVSVASNAFVYTVDLRAPSVNQSGPRLKHKGTVLCLQSPGKWHSSTDSAKPSWMDWGAGGDQLSSVATSVSDLSSITASQENLPTLINGFSENEFLLAFAQLSPDEQEQEQRGKDEACTDQSVPIGPSIASDEPTEMGCHLSSNAFNLVTGSYDRSLNGWDMRYPSKPVKTFELSGYPRRMSLMDDSELWVAQPPNLLLVFDIRQGLFNCVHTQKLPGWTRGFGALVATRGGIFVSGLHGTVEVLHPTCPPASMGGAPLAESLSNAPNTLAVHDDLLAVGCEDGTVHVWAGQNAFSSISC